MDSTEQRENFNAVFTRAGTRVNTWIYSVNQTYLFELKCQKQYRGKDDFTRNWLGAATRRL
jgi:hypothetical protein